MTCAFCSRCIKCFLLHLLLTSLVSTSPASRAVTAWDVSAVSMKQDHSLINHGSSSTGLGQRLPQEAPLSSRSRPCSQRKFSACYNVSLSGNCNLGKQCSPLATHSPKEAQGMHSQEGSSSQLRCFLKLFLQCMS